MEKISELLFRLTKDKHPKAKDNNIDYKIKFVLSSEDNLKILQPYIDKEEKFKKNIEAKDRESIISFFMEEIELMFIDDKRNFSIKDCKIDSETGEQLFPKRGENGKTIYTIIDTITNNPSPDWTADKETVERATELLLKNPLVLEENDSLKALEIVEKYYDLPFFEKEAYKLRILRKIKNDPRDYFVKQKVKYLYKIRSITTEHGILTMLFSESEILSLQRKAAIRIRTSWKNKMKERLTSPYSALLDNKLNH